MTKNVDFSTQSLARAAESMDLSLDHSPKPTRWKCSFQSGHMSVASSSLVTLLVTKSLCASYAAQGRDAMLSRPVGLAQGCTTMTSRTRPKIQSETLVWKDCLSPKWTMGTLNMTKSYPFGTHLRLWFMVNWTHKSITYWRLDSMKKICVCVQWHITLHTGPLGTFWVNAWQSCCSRCDLLGHCKRGNVAAAGCHDVRAMPVDFVKSRTSLHHKTLKANSQE